MKWLSLSFFGLSLVLKTYSQDCTTLGKASFFKSIKFGGQVSQDLCAVPPSKAKVGDYYFYYLDYDSLTESCRKRHSDLFKFLSLTFSHLKIVTNKKGEIYSVDLWSALNDADWTDSVNNRLPDNFTRVNNQLVSLYGHGAIEEDKKNPDTALRKFEGITRMIGWECTHIILRWKVTYGSDIKSMNIIGIHIKCPKFEPVERVMLQN